MKAKDNKANEEVRLKMPREEVRRRLEKQISEGEEFLKISIRNENILETTEQFYAQWHDYTKDLLLKLFSTDKMEQEFVWKIRSYGMHLSLPEKIDEFHKHTQQELNVLRSIRGRLDLYEEDTRTGSAMPVNKLESANKKRVFVVHGRNEKLRSQVFEFLRSIGLEPLEWTQAITLTREPSPYIGKILDVVFTEAQAVVVLLSGDDEAKLQDEFIIGSDPEYEKKLTPQARPNVIFEAGMALGRCPERTVLVQVGTLRPWSDVAGRHVTLLDNTAEKRHELAMKLKTAGCDIDLTGKDWMKAGEFEAPLYKASLVKELLAPRPAPAPIPRPAPAPMPRPAIITKQTGIWNLRMHHEQSTSSPYHLWGHLPWTQDVERVTNGKVKISIYPLQTLMKSQDAWDGVKAGITDISWIFAGYYPGRFDLAECVTLPFIVPSGVVASRVAWNIFQKYPEIQAQIADNKVLTVSASEPYFLVTTKRQVKTLENFKGMKIRTPSGPANEMIKLLGGAPILITMPDVYSCLQKGIIDGILAPTTHILDWRLYEVTSYYTYVPTVCTCFLLVMSMDIWQQMPQDIQQAIMSVSGEPQAIRYGSVFDKHRQDMADFLKIHKYRIVEHSVPPEDMAKWRETAGIPIWNSWVRRMVSKGYVTAPQILSDTIRLVNEYSK